MEKDRVVWLDCVRVCAIAFVVFCHAMEQVYDMSLQGWDNIGLISKVFRTGGFVLGRLGVPLFLFLTGYLVLSKGISSDKDGFRFYKKNLISLLVCTEIWIVIYNMWNAIVSKHGINFLTLILNMCFLKSTNMTNMWYMPMIIGIYLVIPFLAVIVQVYSCKILIIPFSIGVFCNFIIPSLNLVLNIMNIGEFNVVINIMFLGGWCSTYVFWGYYCSIKQINYSLVKKTVLFTISYIVTVASQYIILELGYEYNMWYNFIGILITSAFLFHLIESVKDITLPEKTRQAIMFLSKASLGIFFLHKPVLIVLGHLSSISKLKSPIQVSVLFIFSFLICAIIIRILKPITIIKEKVFLIND